MKHNDTAEVETDITEGEFGQLCEAFYDGRFVGMFDEHEGATQTALFEDPHGHIGLSVCTTAQNGDMFLTLSEWEKEPHHEVDDRWVWVRSEYSEGDQDTSDL